MSWLSLLVLAILVAATLIAIRKQSRPRRVMREGKLLKSEMVCKDGEKFYVEKVAFKDWHVSLHHFYLISDRISEGRTIVEQKWSYEDFCDVTIRLDDYTYALNRQVEVIALVRSFRPIPVEEFDRIARPLIM
ncbi:MAG: hypothetical protein IJ154_09470 [Bacteroidales bacterium]|nr:hypothetical protein [Bacteroidales bacterium]